MNELRHDLTPDAYHADPCEAPSLSASIANLLVGRSPRHAWLAHPKLGGVKRETTKALDRGSLIHRLVLGKGADIVAVDAADWRTKAAQQQRDDAREAGKIPALLADVEDATAAAGEIHHQLADYGIALAGDSEVVALWTEHAEDGTPVQCRAMMDHLIAPMIFDLKSCRSGHPHAIQRHLIGYGYDIQAAAYRSALAAIDPQLAGRVGFTFLFTELEPAVTITPARCGGTMRELGERKWRRAVSLWAACLSSGEWPGYVNDVIDIEAPTWALEQDFEAEYALSDVG